MGLKYAVMAGDYTYDYYAKSKQTNWLIIALLYFVAWSLKYDSAHLDKWGC